MVIALFMLLVAIIVLAFAKVSASDGPAIIGLVAAVSTITGAIAGKQLSALPPNTTTTTSVQQTTPPPPTVVQ
jgi:hypothetical protein